MAPQCAKKKRLVLVDVDRVQGKSYSGDNASRDTPVSQDSLEQLERRIDELIAVCRRLKSENDVLQVGQKDLQQANAVLRDRAQRARVRIEGVISRLKALERSER